MEILHVFGINGKLLLAQGVNFAVAFFVLYRYAYRPILKIVAEREALVARGVEDARAAATAKEAAVAEHDAAIREARTQGVAIVDTAKKEAQEKATAIVHDGEAKHASLLSAARIAGEEERRRLLSSAEAEIAKLAVLGAERIIRERANA